MLDILAAVKIYLQLNLISHAKVLCIFPHNLLPLSATKLIQNKKKNKNKE